jgi:hypothetical protein
LSRSQTNGFIETRKEGAQKTERGKCSVQEVIFANGYRVLYRPDHPRAYKTGRIAEHRLVAEEEILKRPLKPDEVVLHKNGKLDDNRPENLQVLTRRQMTKIIGNRQGKTFGIFRCMKCRRVFLREKRQSHLTKGTMGTFCSKDCSSAVANTISRNIPLVDILSEEENLIGLFVGKDHVLPLKEDFAEVLAEKYKATEEEVEQNIA